MLRKIILLFFVITFSFSSAFAEQSFNEFTSQLYQKAVDKGYSPDVINDVFKQIHLLPQVLKDDRAQAGIRRSWFWASRPRFCAFCYIDRSLSPTRVAEGKRILNQHKGILQQISDQYQIQPQYLLALWGIESNYGKFEGNIPEFSALATLAYDPRRRSFFEHEFFAALDMLQKGDVAYSDMQGSWAGAMGGCQFMPSRFLMYAVDFDHKGYADIWHNQSDTLASAANYLQHAGWRNNSVMVQAVKLGDNFDPKLAGLGTAKPLNEWLRLGVIPKEKLSSPNNDVLYSILAPDHNKQYAFLVDRHNFKVIMMWNHSVSYALSVGLLAREIEG